MCKIVVFYSHAHKKNISGLVKQTDFEANK